MMKGSMGCLPCSLFKTRIFCHALGSATALDCHDNTDFLSSKEIIISKTRRKLGLKPRQTQHICRKFISNSREKVQAEFGVRPCQTGLVAWPSEAALCTGCTVSSERMFRKNYFAIFTICVQLLGSQSYCLAKKHQGPGSTRTFFEIFFALHCCHTKKCILTHLSPTSGRPGHGQQHGQLRRW